MVFGTSPSVFVVGGKVFGAGGDEGVAAGTEVVAADSLKKLRSPPQVAIEKNVGRFQKKADRNLQKTQIDISTAPDRYTKCP